MSDWILVHLLTDFGIVIWQKCFFFIISVKFLGHNSQIKFNRLKSGRLVFLDATNPINIITKKKIQSLKKFTDYFFVIFFIGFSCIQKYFNDFRKNDLVPEKTILHLGKFSEHSKI